MLKISSLIIALGISQICLADDRKLVERGVCLYGGEEYSLGAVICLDGFPIRCERLRTEDEMKRLTAEAQDRYIKGLPPGLPMKPPTGVPMNPLSQMPFWSVLSDPIPACKKSN